MIVAVPDFVVSAIEVAVIVIVCAEAVVAGAVKVAEVVVVFDSVPPPLTVHVTPALFLSLVTVAVSVAVSVPSTEDAEALTETDGEELPPHPGRNDAKVKMTASKDNRL